MSTKVIFKNGPAVELFKDLEINDFFTIDDSCLYVKIAKDIEPDINNSYCFTTKTATFINLNAKVTTANVEIHVL